MYPHLCNEEDNSQWRLVPDQSSGSTGASKFKCVHCGKEQFRGGWGSSIYLEHIDNPTGPLLHSELLNLSIQRNKEREKRAQERNAEWQKYERRLAGINDKRGIFKRFGDFLNKAFGPKAPKEDDEVNCPTNYYR